MKRSDFERALTLYTKNKRDPNGELITKPVAIEVKRKGSSKWIKYNFGDENKIDWDKVDAARLHYADKGWDKVGNRWQVRLSNTTVVRIYPR